MEITAWLAGVTTVANMVKAWMDARKAGLELKMARKKVQERSTLPVATDSEKGKTAKDLVIDPALYRAFVQDINAAMKRFASVVKDRSYTLADIDREQERARLTICTHIKKLRQFNGGKLPSAEMRKTAKSFRCKDA